VDATAATGTGPPLVMTCWWVGDLEALWEIEGYRAFVSALARDHTVVRFDRLASPAGAAGVDVELAQLDAVAATYGEPLSVFGASSGGSTAISFAATRPDAVARLLLYGTFARGSDITSAEVQESLVGLVRAHWGLGSRALADIFMADATTVERDKFAQYQRRVASPEQAAEQLRAVYALDVRDRLDDVHAPTMLVHRRDDRAIPFGLGRELAAAIRDIRFIPLSGRAHFPWVGDAQQVVRPLLAFLGAGAPSDNVADSPLSPRELEVLTLVALGLGDEEIATQLVLSPHTVHRHVANIRRKLGQPSRAAAVAEAGRIGLLP
jgi:pimeloyl-ACP methyl ester carboxylesterase/DNA-binding CsgD family transcriptional regulator